MSKIYVLVGHIASGKSSYCKNAAKQGFIIVNDDEIVNLVHAGNYTLYDKSLKILYKSIENHIISTALAMKLSVVIDRGLNISHSGRRRWLTTGKSFDVSCEAILFDNDGVDTHALRRASSDNRGHNYEYWYKVAKAHDSRFITPTTEEGFDVVHRISFGEVLAGKVFT